jgi:hypothetical protein
MSLHATLNRYGKDSLHGLCVINFLNYGMDAANETAEPVIRIQSNTLTTRGSGDIGKIENWNLVLMDPDPLTSGWQLRIPIRK